MESGNRPRECLYPNCLCEEGVMVGGGGDEAIPCPDAIGKWAPRVPYIVTKCHSEERAAVVLRRGAT
jgi:hypothetical protein